VDDLPPLQTGYTRLAVLLEREREITPGAVASRLGIALEELGPVLVLGDQAVVDVDNDFANRARQALEELGPVQEIGRKVQPTRFVWLRVAVGRNHGLTMAHLRKLLTRADAGPLGRIRVNNTHSLVGLRDDHVEAVIAHLRDQRLNGVPVKPECPPAGSIHESPAYKKPTR